MINYNKRLIDIQTLHLWVVDIPELSGEELVDGRGDEFVFLYWISTASESQAQILGLRFYTLNINLCANETKTVNATLIISISYNLCQFVVAVVIIYIISKTWLSAVQRCLLNNTYFTWVCSCFSLLYTRWGYTLSHIL